jgi:hypothetical protein
MYVMTGDGLNLRMEPTMQSRIIRVLPFLTKVEIIDSDNNYITIDGITAHWYKVNVDNDSGWIFGGYVSREIDIPKIDNRNFITIYRFTAINIGADSIGFENIVKRIRKSYLVIYEMTGNKRYIYDDDGLIDYVPRFGDGPHGSDIIVSGIYEYPWSPTEDNHELTENIQITFKSYRSDSNNRIIYNYDILITYEKIEI